jgi:hypothetical protein
MRRVRRLVALSDGTAQFVPFAELWEFSGILADTFPLDRTLARGPRTARRAGHWARLVMVDHAITNPERTAYFSLSEAPWVPAGIVALAAAAIAPRVPRWLRITSFGAVAVWTLHRGRAARYLAMRRKLAGVAPGALLIADFVTLEPDAATKWMLDALDHVAGAASYVALVPASGDKRRDAARERLYARRLGLRTVGNTAAGGQSVTIMVHDGIPRQSSERTPRKPNHASSATQSAR